MLIWLGKQLLDQADKRDITQEATITEKVARLTLTAEDEEFMRRKARVASPSPEKAPLRPG